MNEILYGIIGAITALIVTGTLLNVRELRYLIKNKGE
jgi:hypothetical protein